MAGLFAMLRVVFDGAGRFSILVASFECFAFVIILFTLTDCDDQFDMVFFREHSQRYDGTTLLFLAI